MTGDSDNIVLFPGFEILVKEVEKLRTELSMLVLERDELVFVECKNLEMSYMLSLGGLEYKAYELQCAVLRLKRKAQLIQAKKNRQEKVSAAEIEKTLDAEFAEYQKKLNEQIEKMNAAIKRSKSDVLSGKDAAELKRLYRMVVKALHPDLHPDETDAMLAMFHNAVAAYENGDIAILRIISEMTAQPKPGKESESGMVALAKEKERLSGLLKELSGRIAEIKNEYPYTMKNLLQDENALEVRKAELEKTVEQLKESVCAYKEKIEQMLR